MTFLTALFCCVVQSFWCNLTFVRWKLCYRSVQISNMSDNIIIFWGKLLSKFCICSVCYLKKNLIYVSVIAWLERITLLSCVVTQGQYRGFLVHVQHTLVPKVFWQEHPAREIFNLSDNIITSRMNSFEIFIWLSCASFKTPKVSISSAKSLNLSYKLQARRAISSAFWFLRSTRQRLSMVRSATNKLVGLTKRIFCFNAQDIVLHLLLSRP